MMTGETLECMMLTLNRLTGRELTTGLVPLGVKENHGRISRRCYYAYIPTKIVVLSN